MDIWVTDPEGGVDAKEVVDDTKHEALGLTCSYALRASSNVDRC